MATAQFDDWQFHLWLIHSKNLALRGGPSFAAMVIVYRLYMSIRALSQDCAVEFPRVLCLSNSPLNSQSAGGLYLAMFSVLGSLCTTIIQSQGQFRDETQKNR